MTIQTTYGAFAAAILLATATLGATAGPALAKSAFAGPASTVSDSAVPAAQQQRSGAFFVFVPGLSASPVQNELAPNTCPALIADALGDAGCMISFCESGWDPSATGRSGEMGWFQIHPAYHADATYDPAGNVAAAYRISSGGTDWSAWSVRSVLETGVCPGGARYPG